MSPDCQHKVGEPAREKNALHLQGFESSVAFVTSHRLILVTLEVSSLLQDVRHIQLDPSDPCAAKFWTLPRWTCPRCSGQPPPSDDIHGKKAFSTSNWNFPSCNLCLLPVTTNLWAELSSLFLTSSQQELVDSKKIFLESSPLQAEQNLLSFCWDTLCFTPQHLGSLGVNQWFRGTFIPMEPKNGVFPLAVLRTDAHLGWRTYCLGRYSWAVLTSPLPVRGETRQINPQANKQQTMQSY